MRYQTRRAAWLVALCAVVSPCLAAEPTSTEAAAPQTLHRIQLFPRADVARVTLTLDAEPRIIWDALHAPERLYVDLQSTVPTGPRRQTIEGKGLVERLRVALTRKTTTRIVLDLNDAITEGVDLTTKWVAAEKHLVVEVRPKGILDLKPAAAAKAISVEAPKAIMAETQAVKAGPPESPKAEKAKSAKAKKILKAFVPPPAPPLPPTPLIAPPRIIVSTVAKNVRDLPELTFWTMPKVLPPAKPSAAKPKATTARTAKKKPAAVAAKLDVPKALDGLSEPEEIEVAEPAANASTLTRALGLKLRRVVLDAGHGGKDVGTISPHGLYEKDLVLDVTLRLGKLIEQRLASEVIYTRDDDTFIPLHERPAVANKEKADLFLSIHANSSRATGVTGFETYYLNFKGTKADMDVAARENASSDKTIADLSDLVRQIAKNEKADESRDFAEHIQRTTQELAVKNGTTRDRGVKRAPFLVLIGAQVPSVLVEIGFLTNLDEEARLKKPAYRQKIAEALLDGIVGYADSLSHFRTASAAIHASDGN